MRCTRVNRKQCTKPAWSYQAPEFPFSCCLQGMVCAHLGTFLIPKGSLKRFGDLSELFSLLHDHSAVQGAWIRSWIYTENNELDPTFLFFVSLASWIIERCQEFLSHLCCSWAQMCSPLADTYCDFLGQAPSLLGSPETCFPLAGAVDLQ